MPYLAFVFRIKNDKNGRKLLNNFFVKQLLWMLTCLLLLILQLLILKLYISILNHFVFFLFQIHRILIKFISYMYSIARITQLLFFNLSLTKKFQLPHFVSWIIIVSFLRKAARVVLKLCQTSSFICSLRRRRRWLSFSYNTRLEEWLARLRINELD